MTSTGVFLSFFLIEKICGKKYFVVQKSRNLHLSALFEVGPIYLEISITRPAAVFRHHQIFTSR